MAYTLDRDAAARRLGISTRTIDRHIQSERIRTRRIGRKMFLEEEDVEALRMNDPSRKGEDYVVVLHEEPLEEEKSMTTKSTTAVESPDTQRALAEFSRIYNESQATIRKKDEVIKDLSYRLGKTETELKKSIDIIEYKKAQYMLETSKTQSSETSRVLGEKINFLQTELQKRSSALIGITILFVLVLVSSLSFFVWDRLL